MKRKLYPVSRIDRILFWLGAFTAPLCVVALYFGVIESAALFGVSAAISTILFYGFQDKQVETGSNEYGAVINQISGIANQLSDLNAFLERERKRVAETESTLAKLKDEKEMLDPIVLTQKETVDAILSAHSARVASNAWKERLIGFGLGILASFVANTGFEYFYQ